MKLSTKVFFLSILVACVFVLFVVPKDHSHVPVGSNNIVMVSSSSVVATTTFNVQMMKSKNPPKVATFGNIIFTNEKSDEILRVTETGEIFLRGKMLAKDRELGRCLKKYFSYKQSVFDQEFK